MDILEDKKNAILAAMKKGGRAIVEAAADAKRQQGNNVASDGVDSAGEIKASVNIIENAQKIADTFEEISILNVAEGDGPSSE